MRKFILTVAALAALMALPAAATPSRNPVLTPADRVELEQFRLTEDNVSRFIAASQEIARENAGPATTDYSITGLAAAVANSPATNAIVEKHGFTAHAFAVTFTAMGSAAITVLAAEENQPSAAEGVYSSQENVDFYKAHRAQMDAFMGTGRKPAGSLPRAQ